MRSKVIDSIFKGQWQALIMVGLFSIVFNVLMLTSPLFMLAVFSNVMTSKNLDTLILLSVAAAVALGFQGLIDYVRTRLLVRVGIALDLALSPQVIEAMIVRAGHPGSEDRHALNDAAEIRKFVTDIGVMSLIDLPFVPLYLLVLWWLHPVLGSVGVAAALGLLLLAVINDGLTRRPSDIAQAATRRRANLTSECLGNADSLRSMGMVDAMIERCRRATLESLHALELGADRAAISRTLVRALRIGIQMSVYAVGAWLYLEDQLMVGAIVAASVLLGRALSPLEYAVFAWRSAIAMREAHRRLGALLGSRSHEHSAERSEPDSETAVAELRRATVVSPESNRVLLNSVSLALAPGELLGIIGPSGAGKSSLGRLLAGVGVARSGSAWFKGRRIDVFRSSSDGACVGYCPQQPQLFAGTITANIARFSESERVDAVMQAARLVGLHDRVEALAEGYGTYLLPDGYPLSAGMRQQIALARAFYGSPDLLVLDEPAAWLDQAAQVALIEAIEVARARGAAVAVMTHQPGLLRNADRIAVMKAGAIEMIGPRFKVFQQLGGRASRATPVEVASAERDAADAGRAQAPPTSEDSAASARSAGSFVLSAPRPGQEQFE
jgi:PrtD family type I secretion system ABC transporter